MSKIKIDLLGKIDQQNANQNCSVSKSMQKCKSKLQNQQIDLQKLNRCAKCKLKLQSQKNRSAGEMNRSAKIPFVT